jgi:Zn-dependent protease with chaperone function
MTILKSFGFSEKSNFASLVIFMKFYEVLIFITGKIQTAFVRKMEFKADQFAVTEFKDLKKFQEKQELNNEFFDLG